MDYDIFQKKNDTRTLDECLGFEPRLHYKNLIENCFYLISIQQFHFQFCFKLSLSNHSPQILPFPEFKSHNFNLFLKSHKTLSTNDLTFQRTPKAKP